MSYRLRTTIIICLFLSLPVSAWADSLARQLLHASGVESHLHGVMPDIIKEISAARANCTESGGLTDDLTGAPGAQLAELAEMVRQLFAGDTLTATAERSLGSALTPAEQANLTRWMRSSLGRRIRAAETAVADLSETQFDSRVQTLLADSSWTASRRAVIRQLVKATRADAFVVALQSEVGNAIELASACDHRPAALSEIDRSILAARNDEAFHAMFMGLSLVVPTGVVFRELSDETLNDYLAFIRSAAGRRFHQALVDATGTAMRSAVDAFHERLIRTAG